MGSGTALGGIGDLDEFALGFNDGIAGNARTKNPSAGRGFTKTRTGGLPTAAAAMATAAPIAALFRLGHVDTDGTAIELGAIEDRHGRLGLGMGQNECPLYDGPGCRVSNGS